MVPRSNFVYFYPAHLKKNKNCIRESRRSLELLIDFFYLFLCIKFKQNWIKWFVKERGHLGTDRRVSTISSLVGLSANESYILVSISLSSVSPEDGSYYTTLIIPNLMSASIKLSTTILFIYLYFWLRRPQRICVCIVDVVRYTNTV